MEKIRVFLSDPQILFREGIHFTLSGEEDFEVTGEATDNTEALAAMEANPPDVAILNIGREKPDGAEATRRLRLNSPLVSVILVADSETGEQAFLAMKSGAVACLTKDADPDLLVAMIRDIARGSRPIVSVLLVPAMAAKVIAEFEASSGLNENLRGMLARLSPREMDLLKRIAEGNTLEQVAAKAGGSEELIRHQLQPVVQKLVANDQVKAIIDIAQKSLIDSLQTSSRKPGY